MGNWRRVYIIGTCDDSEVAALKRAVRFDPYNDDLETPEEFGPLSNSGGLSGLNDWPAQTINAIGNLAERNYSVKTVVEHINKLALVAPSLRVKIYCGDDWESSKCVGVVIKEPGLDAFIDEPDIDVLPEIPESQMLAAILKHLGA